MLNLTDLDQLSHIPVVAVPDLASSPPVAEAACGRCAAYQPNPRPDGNLQVDPEIRLPSPGFDVQIGYCYNSVVQQSSPFGYGWTITPNMTLLAAGVTAYVTLTRGDGALANYVASGAGSGTFIPLTPGVSASGPSTYTYNTANERMSFGTPTLSWSSSYDANGNLIVDTDPSTLAVANYIWDPSNRLTAVQYPSGGGSPFANTYDANGLRQSNKLGTTLTEFVWDNQNLLAQQTKTGVTVTGWQYSDLPGVWGGLVSQREINVDTSSFFTFDPPGNCLLLMQSGGTSASSSQVLTPFGVSLASAGSLPPFQFGGQYGYLNNSFLGTTVALVNIGGRWYIVNHGDWISRDPLPVDLGGSLNPYEFVGNNPVSWIDPSGLEDAVPPTSIDIGGLGYGLGVAIGTILGPGGPHKKKHSKTRKNLPGCTGTETSQIKLALYDLCHNRLQHLTDPTAKVCAHHQCSRQVFFRCVGPSDADCQAQTYNAPPGSTICTHASEDNTTDYDVIYICPGAFTNPQCGCLGKNILWEMFNNCDPNSQTPSTPYGDSSLCIFAPTLFGPGTPKCP